MKRSTFRKMEDVLRDYPLLNRKIESVEEEIRYPYREPDDNVGGGKAQYKKTQPELGTLILLEDDERIKSFKMQRQAVDECLDEACDDAKTIIRELYFVKHPKYTIDGLVTNHLIAVSHSPAYNLRQDFICNLAHKLGWYDIQ